MRKKLTMNNKCLKSHIKHRALRPICFLFFVFCLLNLTPYIFAAEKLELTLKEAIDISLRENLSLSKERLSTSIAEAEIKVKEGEFDPVASLKLKEDYKKNRAASILSATEERSFGTDLGIEGKINTGTTYELKWSNKRIESNLGFMTINPYYTSELTLTLTQPLLKGIGREVQESNLNVAKNSLEMARLAADEKAIATIADTANAYWDLAFTRYDIDVAELSLKLARNLLNEVKAKIDAGTLAPVEIYKAEAETSLREEALLKAKKLAQDAADKLRVTMNLKDWQAELIPVEKLPQPSEPQPLQDALDTALNNRHDYKQALIERKNKEILRRYYDNQKYPDLSLTGAVGLNGLGETYSTATHAMSSYHYYSWQMGLSLKIPIGNRAAEGNYLKAKYEEEKADIALKILEQKIISEVREAWRALQLASETIKTARKTRVAAEKKFEAEEGRFKVGMATLNDVLKFQEEFAKALSSEKKAEVDYAKAVIEFERVKGTLGHAIF